MAINATSKAAATVASVKNVPLSSVIQLPRKILIIGQYDEDNKTDIVENTLYQVTSAEDVGAKFGYGFMLHRLAIAAYRGSRGDVETWCIPQEENDLAEAAYNRVQFATTGSIGGKMHMYISGEKVEFTTAQDDSAGDIADLFVAAVSADRNLPVTATAVAPAGWVNLPSKGAGAWSGLTSVRANLGYDEEFPAGISIDTFLTSFPHLNPDIQPALDAAGLNDEQNMNGFTDLIHGYQYEGYTE